MAMKTLKNFNRIIYCLIFTFCCSKLFPQHYNAQQIDTLLIKTNEELRTRLSNKAQDCRFFLRYVYSTRAVYFSGTQQLDSSLIYLHKAMKIDPNP